ncbi:hypothetical protein N7533_009960 [Penicillium manginii]|uniref:uncharacterized protein n=1 Tax=Penicillium manginii TaxID=203109 RepID=UPI0025483D99|nr:uncharacterized protein N7533_009960 [Penicillium manginii]KAJ5742858.1 hypothetical protein N7533_009960 [Penicillium manginii]
MQSIDEGFITPTFSLLAPFQDRATYYWHRDSTAGVTDIPRRSNHHGFVNFLAYPALRSLAVV